MTDDPAGLSGKVALVTGGASGIGAGIARVLAARGARVAIGDLDRGAAAAAAAGLLGGGLGLRLDVTDRASTGAAVGQVEERLGPVDVLVNNAGVSNVAPFLEITDQDWDRLMNVNLRGVLIVTQRVLAAMRRAAVRPRHQHLLDGRQGRTPEPGALLRHQVRGDRPYPGAGEGGRALQRHRQRRLPRAWSARPCGTTRQPGSCATSTARKAGRPSLTASRSAARRRWKTSGTHAPTWPATSPPTSPGEALNVSGGQQMH